MLLCFQPQTNTNTMSSPENPVVSKTETDTETNTKAAIKTEPKPEPPPPPPTPKSISDRLRLAVQFGNSLVRKRSKANKWKWFTVEIVDGPVTNKYFLGFCDPDQTYIWPLQLESSYTKIGDIYNGKCFKILDARNVGPDPKPNGPWDHKYVGFIKIDDTLYDDFVAKRVDSAITDDVKRQSDWPTLRVLENGTLEEYPLSWAMWNESIHSVKSPSVRVITVLKRPASAIKPTSAKSVVERLNIAAAFSMKLTSDKAFEWQNFTAEIVDGPTVKKYFFRVVSQCYYSPMWYRDGRKCHIYAMQREPSYEIVLNGEPYTMSDMRLVGPDPKPNGDWDHKYFSFTEGTEPDPTCIYIQHPPTYRTLYNDCAFKKSVDRQSDWPTLRILEDGTLEEHPLTWAEWNESIHSIAVV